MSRIRRSGKRKEIQSNKRNINKVRLHRRSDKRRIKSHKRKTEKHLKVNF